MERKLRILAFHSHPDDVEFTAAGTLALLRAQGHAVVIATMTLGDLGTDALPRPEIARIRRREAERSAGVIGAEFRSAGFGDLAFTFEDGTRRRVVEILRASAPDIVLTAPPEDYMVDHEITSRLVRDAAFASPMPNYRTGAAAASPPLSRVPYLYYVDPVEGRNHRGSRWPPGFWVDISPVFSTKREMLACHESQREWLRRQHGMDQYLAFMEAWSRARGEEVGVAYAEAFCQHLGHAYPRENILADLLGDRVHGPRDEGHS